MNGSQRQGNHRLGVYLECYLYESTYKCVVGGPHAEKLKICKNENFSEVHWESGCSVPLRSTIEFLRKGIFCG